MFANCGSSLLRSNSKRNFSLASVRVKRSFDPNWCQRKISFRIAPQQAAPAICKHSESVDLLCKSLLPYVWRVSSSKALLCKHEICLYRCWYELWLLRKQNEKYIQISIDKYNSRCYTNACRFDRDKFSEWIKKIPIVA